MVTAHSNFVGGPQRRPGRRRSVSRSSSTVAYHAQLRASASLLLLIIVAALHDASMASSSDNGGPPSPIKHLGPSLAASVAASTVVAVTAAGDPDGDDNQCCVILTKSFSERPRGDGDDADTDAGLSISTVFASTKSFGTDDSSSEDANEIQQQELHPLTPGRCSPSLTILSITSHPLLLALTGFSPDVQHLSLSAAKLHSDHRHLYGGLGMRTDKLANMMASRLAEAAMGEGGRPYGVQALVVGDRHGDNNGGGSSGSKGEMQLYTIDPSGGCRHWSGGGAVVGRDADLVRRCLDRCLRPPTKRGSNDNDDNDDDTNIGRGTPRDWKEALDRALMATIEASSPPSDGSDKDDRLEDEEGGFAKSGKYRAIVAFSRGCSNNGQDTAHHESSCFEIGSDTLEESYKRCIQWLAEENNDRNNNRRLRQGTPWRRST